MMLLTNSNLARAALVLFMGLSAITVHASSDRNVAHVEGPVTGGTRGYPYSASIVDLAPYGYSESEYFVSGVARVFKPAPGSVLTPDGRWHVVAGVERPYKTRILVRKPPASRFNGTVVVEFMQEYFGTERDTNYRWNAETILRQGFGWVGVSLHHEGIDDPKPPQTIKFGDTSFTTGLTLARWDPERYGLLSVPSSDLSYDILSQVGRALGPQRPTDGVDPLAGLKVRKLIAVGDTVAGHRLAIYINAVQPTARVFDGFILKDFGPNDLKLAEDVVTPSSQLRTDTAVPVIVFQTTTAATQTGQQPEGPKLRFWTPAGSSHTTGPYMTRVARANRRDLGQDGGFCPESYANTFPQQYVSGAAIVAVDRWIKTGKSAGSFPQLEVIDKGQEKITPLDEHGNSVGGLRTPWVDVPRARYDWRGECPGGSGRTFPFAPEQLRALYGKPANYQRKFSAAVRAAQKSGVLLREDAEAAIRDAALLSW